MNEQNHSVMNRVITYKYSNLITEVRTFCTHLYGAFHNLQQLNANERFVQISGDTTINIRKNSKKRRDNVAKLSNEGYPRRYIFR